MVNSINDNHVGSVTFHQNGSIARAAMRGAALGAAFSAGELASDVLNLKKAVKAIGTKDSFVASEKLRGTAFIKGTRVAVPAKLAEEVDYDTVKGFLETSLINVKKQAPKRLAKTAAIGAAIFGGFALAGKMVLNHARKAALNNIKLDIEEHTGEKVEIIRDKKNKNQYNVSIVN